MQLPFLSVETLGLHKLLGAVLAGELSCDKCAKAQPCSAEQATAFLRSGWPSCCGRTMTLRVASAGAAERVARFRARPLAKRSTGKESA